MTQRLNPFRLFFEILACVALATVSAFALQQRLVPPGNTNLALPIGVMLVLLLSGPLMLWRCLAAGVKTSRARGQMPVRSLRSAIVITLTTLFTGLGVSAVVAWQLQLADGHGWLFGLFCAVLSCILALVVWLLAFGRARARALAREMTADLQRLAKVVEHTSNAVVITDARRRIVWVNQGFARVTGYSSEEAIGQSPGALLQFGKTDRAEVERMRAALNEGVPFKGEILNRGRDGREYWLSLEIQPLHGEDGELTGFMAIESDVSERKVMEEAVRHSQEILRGAIDAVDEAFVLYGPDDRLVLCNEKFRQMNVQSADLIVPGASFESILRGGAERGQYPAATGRVDEWVAQQVAIHRRGDASTIQQLDDGRTLRVVERRMADGHAVGFRIDITDLVKATETAQQALRAKSEFLANMSHEIRTPMNAVIGMTSLALEGELNNDQRELMTIVKESADSLLRLINDILDFSKVEAGQLALENIDFDLRECLGAAVRMLAAKVREKGLTLEWAVAADVPRRVLGDPHRLRQILLNLLSNGMKFTAHGGLSVVVSARSASGAGVDGSLIHVRVRDSGIGIASDKLDLIFRPFSQADTSTTREFGGTGLGLSICRSLVAQMGGELWVESCVGQGSTFHFTIRLPAVEEKATPLLAARGVCEVLVLLPEGDEDADLLKCLRQWHMQPRIVSDWATALQALDNGKDADPVLSLLVKSSMLSSPDFESVDRQLAQSGMRSRVIVLDVAGAPHSPDGRLMGVVPWPSVPSHLFDAIADVAGFADSALAALDMPAGTLAPLQPYRHRILLAEDNAINQMLARRLLEQLGHEVHVVENGALAVERSGAEHFDLVFLDVQMPVMGGFEATTAIRVRDRVRGCYTPIVAMTAHAMEGDRERCLAIGMDDYVSKPISKAALNAAVREHALCGVRTAEPDNAPAHAHSGDAGTAPLPQHDRALAIERLGGDAELLEEIADIFLMGAKDQLLQLLAAHRNGDFKDLQARAHALRGSVAALAAEPLRKLSGDLECACERRDGTRAQSLLRDIERALPALVKELVLAGTPARAIATSR